ncbi:TIGR00341 family protein [Geomonas paludis]|uniref:Membrane protein n=1 Tax=Geomonas paludis TaxID=2740185 RepID=A0A6V8MRL1_9BACT|nr:TIGR00341 family protein [Geomonas paludis]UPU35789.1 TIGR00341 family protein [Geomonas paludis]GFO62631.1 membrane protein [Geomonas paludis]
MAGTGSPFYRGKMKAYLAMKADMVQHREVIREVAASVDGSWVYYVMLILAAVIALLGLLLNSVAVVIGAMLISPLMGPIISSSLSFTIGDLALVRRTFRTLGTSIALTLAVSALITLLSPLKEPTAEILSRVRPNILDLFIAALSGVAGAVALCTKRNYLITSTGVAVATAVIPPLSVAGYGLGTWQPMLALGGFLLFFTNFVAIILSSDIVFFILGFRTSHVEAPQHSHRTRLVVITTVLTLISVPLVYTLSSDVTRIKNEKRIGRVLKSRLDRELASRLTGYRFRQEGKGVLVMASVNTVRFVAKPAQREIEKELAQGLGRPVRLELEQVIVASESQLKDVTAKGGAAQPGKESPAELVAKMRPLVVRVEQELAAALVPFEVSHTAVAFSGDGGGLLVNAMLARDYGVSDDERLLLSRQLQQALGVPVRVEIRVTPMLPPIVFAGDGSLTPESKNKLEVLRHLPEGPSAFRFVVAGPKESGGRLRFLGRYLAQQLAVPAQAVTTATSRGRGGAVTLRVVRYDNVR